MPQQFPAILPLVRLGALAFSLVATASASGPTQILNATKYKGSNSPFPATGRSGSASLQARALLAKDGSSLLEMSTGDLDSSSTAPGNINMAQVKGFDAAGLLRYNKNYTNLNQGGYLAYTYHDLLRRQPIQVQTNIGGINGTRTDVVTVKTNVVLRADLRAQDLVAPTRAMVNTAVNISATIREINTDLGARANVVLYVDGTAVDRAEGIWVTAGGTVSAAFTHRFITVGSHQLDVKVENVIPGDYDTSNNAVSGSIEIVEPTVALNYWASVFDGTDRSSNHSWGSYTSTADNVHGDWNSTWDQTGPYQSISLSFWSDRSIAFPLTSITVDESTDGTSVASIRNDDVHADIDNTWSWDHYTLNEHGAFLWDGTTYTYTQVMNYDITDTSTNQNVGKGTLGSYGRYAGDVTYHSVGYGTFWYGSEGNFYSWNNDGSYQYGLPITPMGNSVTIDMKIQDATGTTFQAKPVITSFTPFSYGYSQPWSCYQYTSGNYSYFICNDFTEVMQGKIGTVSGWGN